LWSAFNKVFLVYIWTSFSQLKSSNCKQNFSDRIKTTAAGSEKNKHNDILLFVETMGANVGRQFVICFLSTVDLLHCSSVEFFHVSETFSKTCNRESFSIELRLGVLRINVCFSSWDNIAQFYRWSLSRVLLTRGHNIFCKRAHYINKSLFVFIARRAAKTGTDFLTNGIVLAQKICFLKFWFIGFRKLKKKNQFKSAWIYLNENVRHSLSLNTIPYFVKWRHLSLWYADWPFL